MDKDLEYKAYIDEHIANVSKVWKDIQEHLVGEFWLDDFYWFLIDGIIKEHDKSKYGHDEFSGYRQWFFTEEHEEKNLKSFEFAWNNHQKNNRHHWEYWLYISVNSNKSIIVRPLEIPYIYIFEMLCDWTAMSYKFGDTPSEFYEKNIDDMMLAEGTLSCVERHLPIFDKIAIANRG